MLVSTIEASGIQSRSSRTKPECYLFEIIIWFPKMTAKGTRRIVKLG